MSAEKMVWFPGRWLSSLSDPAGSSALFRASPAPSTRCASSASATTTICRGDTQLVVPHMGSAFAFSRGKHAWSVSVLLHIL